MHPARFPYQKPPKGIGINWSHPLSNRLVGAFLFDDGPAEALFNRVNQLNSSAWSNSPTWEIGSKGSYALCTAGNSEHIDLTSSNGGLIDQFGNNDITISFLVSMPAAVGNSIIVCGGWTALEEGLHIAQYYLLDETLEFEMALGDGTRPINVTPSTAYPIDTWFRITWSIDRDAGYNIYFDDVNVYSAATDTSASTCNAAYQWRIGDRPVPTGYTTVRMADCFIWNGKALTDAEVKAFAREPYAMFYSPSQRAKYFAVTLEQEGWTWGEQNPTPETAVAWSVWKVKETTNDARDSGDWGELQLGSGESFVSDVKDRGNTDTRYLTLSYDDYSVGSGSGTLYWRGQAAIFNYDDNEVAGPAWEEYAGPANKDWRYIQVMCEG